MYLIERRASFEYAHRLMDHPGMCKFLHGHSGVAIVQVASDSLDDQGMVIDFKYLKQAMDQVLDKWDHATILQEGDPLVPVLQALGQNVAVYKFQPTAECLSRTMFQELKKIGLEVSKVTIYETEKNCASVEY